MFHVALATLGAFSTTLAAPAAWRASTMGPMRTTSTHSSTARKKSFLFNAYLYSKVVFYYVRRYSICIRQEEGFCCVEFFVCPDQTGALPGGAVSEPWKALSAAEEEQLLIDLTICWVSSGSPSLCCCTGNPGRKGGNPAQ